MENCSLGVKKKKINKKIKKNQTTPTSPHVWEGFKKNPLHSFKNKLQHIQLSVTTETSNGIRFCGQMKRTKKKAF